LNIILCILYLGPMGERLDDMIGGNPNPTQGQIYGGAPGVGGGQFGGQYGGGQYGGGQYGGGQYGGGW
jgi:hypothetical protein